MSMLKSHVFIELILLLLFSYSCQLQEKETDIISWELNIENAKNYEYYDILKDINLVQLESCEESYFGTISGFDILNNNYVIKASQGSNDVILIFNSQGRFVWKTPLGKGTYEFGNIWGYSVNESGQELIIFESNRMTIVDCTGNTKEVVRFREHVGTLSGKHYYSQDGIITRNIYGDFYRISNSGGIQELKSQDYGFDGSWAQIEESSLKPLIKYTYDNYLYTIENDSIVPKYFMDFGKNSLQMKQHIKSESYTWANDIIRNYKQSLKVFSIQSFTASQNGHFFFTTRYNNEFHGVLCDEKSKSHKILSRLNAGVNLRLTYFPLLRGDLAYFIIPVRDVDDVEVGSYSEKYSDVIQYLSEADFESNPVIIFGELK